MSNITGVAIKTDEYVPMITPTIRANIKPRIDSPPKRKIANNIKNVWHLEIFKNTTIIKAHWNNGNKQNFRNFGNIEM